MGVTKRDRSGVFDAELRARRARKSAVLDEGFNLSSKGITFISSEYLPEWTEVGVEMRLPSSGVRKNQQIDCRGVVVQCARREQGKGFEVALVFLDLPKQAQADLIASPAAFNPFSISIAR